jgi:SAM-dependent methyltransferase
MPHDWDAPEYIRRWVEEGDRTDPQRVEQIRLLVSLVRSGSEEPINVLDLGAGYGVVTREVITACPNVTVVCLDGSAEMLKHGKERLADCLDQLRFVQADFDSPDWLAALQVALPPGSNGINGWFDAILSSRAIHHTVDERKQELYREIFDLLKPGGYFANHDIVRQPGEPVNDSGNPFSTVEEQLEWLGEIGFVDVQCFWRAERRALFGGHKPR